MERLSLGAHNDWRASTVARRSGVFTNALHGFEVHLTEPAARRLAPNPAADYVEQNHTVSAADTQPNAVWGLDRVNQPSLPMNAKYTFPNVGAGVHGHVLDTGVRKTHEELGGRVGSGFDAIGGTGTDDCNGHGTHVVGILGGARHGRAKGVTLVQVRVLDCSANGTFAALIAGVDWVTANAVKPAVANISLNGTTNTSVARSIASGVVYVVAASNQADDACTRSPASAIDAITPRAHTARTSDRGATIHKGTYNVSSMSSHIPTRTGCSRRRTEHGHSCPSVRSAPARPRPQARRSGPQ
ncbi:hypothetical protein C8D87_115118 [Lentzea atacamensis]|uniref:Peptidase S8/S53 domain-containing protein n=1 Tax=Lentzea atacamensis TaxID=531938 RepID=A0ABX9DVQ5_9PSEU|nr:hypothetical protein C8D87_115118 [Lentzea atacamensis]